MDASYCVSLLFTSTSRPAILLPRHAQLWRLLDPTGLCRLELIGIVCKDLLPPAPALHSFGVSAFSTSLRRLELIGFVSEDLPHGSLARLGRLVELRELTIKADGATQELLQVCGGRGGGEGGVWPDWVVWWSCVS